GVIRPDNPRPMYGARATLHSDATKLTAFLALLANVRTLRDYGYGLCLENASQFPELRNETIEQLSSGVVRIRREQIGGNGYAMELPIHGGAGTNVAGRDPAVP